MINVVFLNILPAPVTDTSCLCIEGLLSMAPFPFFVPACYMVPDTSHGSLNYNRTYKV